MDWRESLAKNLHFFTALIKLKLKKYWEKRYGKPAIILTLIVVLLFIFNYIGIGFFFHALLGGKQAGFFPSFMKIRQSFRESARDKRRINLTLKVTDQFGKEVPDYKLAVTIDYIRWYYGIFPVTGLSGKHKYFIKTDSHGIAVLKPFLLRKGNGMSLDEVDRSQYVFSYRNSLKFRNEAIRPKGGAVLSWVDPEGKGQYVELLVLRHGPPVQLVRYRPKLKLGFEELEAKDKNIFALEFVGNKLNKDETNGDVVVTITKTDKIVSQYPRVLNMPQNEVSIFRKELLSIPLRDFESNWVWSVEIEGRNGYMLQQADNEVVTFAPMEGYKKRLIYHLAYTGYPLNVIESRLVKNGWTNVDNITNANPINQKDDELIYNIIGGIPKRFFIRKEKEDKKDYGIIDISLSLDYRGKILVSSHGVFNHDDNNLWEGC